MVMDDGTIHGSEPIVGVGIPSKGKTNEIQVNLIPRKVAEADIMTQVLPSSSIKDSQEFKKISESILKLSQD